MFGNGLEGPRDKTTQYRVKGNFKMLNGAQLTPCTCSLVPAKNGKVRQLKCW